VKGLERGLGLRFPAVGGQIMEWLGERARLGSWRGERRVAQLSPVASTPLSAAFVSHCLGRLRAGGYTSVISTALPAAECQGFLGAGFDVREELHLLSHDLEDVPRPPPGLRTVRRHDHPAILDLDSIAFEPFWQLGMDGLDDALRATPHVRFRMAGHRQQVTGYVLAGSNGAIGYLQRLAVHPSARGAGLGRALVSDGLWWMRRHGVRRALVNTQRHNQAALALYRACGFRLQPDALCVLERSL
jgi:ribosomal protein S18 acetylase RimI-like enzyme